MAVMPNGDETRVFIYNPEVRVKDLWAVFPELDTGGTTEAEFAKKVRQAAIHARQKDAYEELRDVFEDSALHTTLHTYPDLVNFDKVDNETEDNE